MNYTKIPRTIKVKTSGTKKYAFLAVKASRYSVLFDVSVSPMTSPATSLGEMQVTVFSRGEAAAAYIQLKLDAVERMPWDKEGVEVLPFTDEDLAQMAIGNYIVTQGKITEVWPYPAVLNGHVSLPLPNPVTVQDAYEVDNCGNSSTGWNIQGYLFIVVELPDATTATEIGVTVTLED